MNGKKKKNTNNQFDMFGPSPLEKIVPVINNAIAAEEASKILYTRRATIQDTRRATIQEPIPAIIKEGDIKPIVNYEFTTNAESTLMDPVKTYSGKLLKPNSYPIYITVKSDGNILQLVGNKNKILTYKYVKSKTKLNSLVTFTEELLEKFIETNK